MATAAYNGVPATSSAYEGSGGGGAGGKFRKLQFRRNKTTPYDRPTPALGRNPNWLTKLVSSGAQWFFSSLFRKRLTAPPTVASQGPKELQQESCPNDHAGAAVDGTHEVRYAPCGPEGSAFSDLEQLLKQKTLSRAEIDRLTELLHSKSVDTPVGNDKRSEAICYRPLPDFSICSLEKNRSEKVTYDAAVATPVTSSRVPKDDAELAKAYMGTRPSKASPSVLNSQSQIVRVDTPLLKDVSYSLSLPVTTSMTRKTAGLVGVRANGFLTPRYHGRSAIYNMARTPCGRNRQTDIQMASSSRNNAYGGTSSSESVLEHNGCFGYKQSLKRRGSVLEADLGSVGPMRRTRLKPNLLSHGVSRPSPGAGASAASVHLEVPKVVGDSEDNTTIPTSYFHIPSKSSETAAKILDNLKNLTPKEKPSESKLAAGKDKTPKKVTPNMIHGQALKSLEALDSPKLLKSAQDSHKSENWSKVVPTNGHDSNLQKQGKIEQNGQKKLSKLTVVAKKDAECSFKDAEQGVQIADPMDKSSAAQPQKKQAFRMSAPEDSFELDEDINADGSASLLAEGRYKMVVSGADKNSLSTDEALNKPAPSLAKKASPGVLTKRNDMEAPDAAVTSVKTTSSLPSANPLPQEGIPPSFGSDKSKEPNVDEVPAFPFSSSPLLTELKPESSSSLSNPAFVPAGALSKPFESDNSQDTKNSCQLEASSSGLSPSTSFAAPSSTSSFSIGQFSSIPAISATYGLASINVPKDIQSGSSSEFAPSTSISATIGSTTANPITSCSSLSGSAAASAASTDSLIKFGPSEVPPTDSAVSTTSSADNADLIRKETIFGNLTCNSPFAGSSFASPSPGDSIFGFSSSGMSTVTTTNFESQSSVFSTDSQLLNAQTSLCGSDNATISQSAPAHFGSTSPAEVGNSGMASFSSAGSASNNTAIVSAASSDNNLVGSSAVASVKFSFGTSSSAPSMVGRSVVPSSGTTQLAFTFVATPAISTAVTTTLATSSNMTSGMFGVNSSSSSTNAVDTSTRPGPGIFNFGGNSSAPSLHNISTPITAAPGVLGLGGGSTSLTNGVSTSTSATTGVFSFGVSSSFLSTNAVNASTVSPSQFAFGATSASSQTSTPAGNFGSSWQPQKSLDFSSPFTSATPSGFTFGASSSSFTAPSTAGVVFGSAPSTSSSQAPTYSSSQSIFGNSIPPFTASHGNNGQMNMEDSMAEDPVHASSIAVSFGQHSVLPSPGGFIFSSTPNPYQFGGQQIQPAAQNPSPFAAPGSLDLGGGGSFSLGSIDPKSGRRVIKPNRNRNRRK